MILCGLQDLSTSQSGSKWIEMALKRRLLDKLDFPNMGFSLYFLASVPKEEATPEPGTVEAHQFLWSYPGTTLESRRGDVNIYFNRF